MQSFPINYLALLVATLVKFFIGFAWFSFLFGKQWAALMKMDPAQMGNKSIMIRGMITDLAGGFIMAYVLVHAVHYAGATTVTQGAIVGFFNWLGFIGVTTLSSNTWENRPFALWLIGNGYLLLSLLIMGGIVAVWV
jgi:hypothetical protein